METTDVVQQHCLGRVSAEPSQPQAWVLRKLRVAPVQSVVLEETDSRQGQCPYGGCEPLAVILEEKERSVGLSGDEMLLGFPGRWADTVCVCIHACVRACACTCVRLCVGLCGVMCVAVCVTLCVWLCV